MVLRNKFVMISDDSWSAIFKPPSSESASERQDRIARQQEASKISKEIDDAIDKSKKLFDKRKKAIKVLLLGQAESGKSTMLRNFQLAFCPNYFLREIPIWKIIIQLNLIGSVKKLLAIIEAELDPPILSPRSSLSSLRSPMPPITFPSERTRRPSTSISSRNLTTVPDSSDPPLTQAHSALRLRLLPLLSVETNLARQLLPEFGGVPPPLPSATGWTKWASGTSIDSSNGFLFGNDEICVRAGGAWKAILARISGSPRSSSDSPQSRRDDHNAFAQPIDPTSPSLSGSFKHCSRPARRHPSDPTPLLEALAPDIHALWTDPAVCALLKRKGVHMEHSAGFFLNDVMRIGKPGWNPDIDDIVRARLRTFGVEEHRFVMDNGSEWYFYDVGGNRGTRHQWVSYFDDVQAVIFLASLEFDQMLDEDQRVNRLEDSISLWKQVCANPLLARANIILFLNKMDILRSTLEAGVRVQTYVPTYSQPNDLEHVVKYFRDKFRAYHKHLSPKQRSFFCHETSAIDTTATQAIIVDVREGILRSHLEKLRIV